jgi:hypothetical protein
MFHLDNSCFWFPIEKGYGGSLDHYFYRDIKNKFICSDKDLLWQCDKEELDFSRQREPEQQGWQIPTQLLAPPRPPPPPRRESTPVSMSTIVLLSVLMLSVKPSDARRVGFVDVSAFVPELLMCRPSCWSCWCVGLHAENVVVSFRVDFLLAGFGNLPM